MQPTHISFTPLATAAQKPKGADIWLLDFSALTENQSAAFSHLVSAEELARAQTFKRNRHHFLATRALVRTVLAYYTGLPSASLEFAKKEQGKPYLINVPSPIYFNLSHSGNVAALAVSAAGEIGVDIETIRPRNFLAIAERYFHADELTQLLALPEAKREALFFQLWTLKEAFFKATGGGISSGLDKACFQITDKNICVNFADELHTQPNHWQFEQAVIAHNCLMAVALKTTKAMQCQFFDGKALLLDALPRIKRI